MNDPGLFQTPCPICKVRKAVRWCDFVIKYNRNTVFVRDFKQFQELNSSPNDETCDLPMCEECSHHINGADLCPHHYHLYKQAALPKHLQKAQAREKMIIAQEVINSYK